METIDTLPEWRRISSEFPIKVRATTTDRYAANYRTEDGLQSPGYMEDFLLLHLACDAHRAATSIKATLAQCEADVSGLLNTALALSELGVLKRLRDLLTALFFREMDVIELQPPNDMDTQNYREEVFARFLPLDGRTANLNRKRRMVLQTMLNGKIQQGPLQHYCPPGALCCNNSRQQTMTTCALYVTWALVPFQCPAMSRKNWLNQTANMDWVGALESHHGLFTRLMTLHLGSAKTIVPGMDGNAQQPDQKEDAPAVQTDPAGDGFDMWQDALLDELVQSHAAEEAPAQSAPCVAEEGLPAQPNLESQEATKLCSVTVVVSLYAQNLKMPDNCSMEGGWCKLL